MGCMSAAQRQARPAHFRSLASYRCPWVLSSASASRGSVGCHGSAANAVAGRVRDDRKGVLEVTLYMRRAEEHKIQRVVTVASLSRQVTCVPVDGSVKTRRVLDSGCVSLSCAL